MLNGIFYNAPKASCSIHETGVMCFNALSLSDKYTIEYTEQLHRVNKKFDFAVFNHHPWVNNWIENSIHEFEEDTYCIVTEVGHGGHVMPYTPFIFGHYLILDPTIIDTENVYGFPRPLELVSSVRKKENNQIVIGSFGLPTPGKNWIEIVERTQQEFNEALIRFHIPEGTHVPDSARSIQRIKQECTAILHKESVKIDFSHHYMNKNELIDWCTQNTINVFLYNRNQTGLSATTDQAVISERPIYVSKNETFRHVLQYLHPYPATITEAIDSTLPAVMQMKKDWSPREFAIKFESILLEKPNETD